MSEHQDTFIERQIRPHERDGMRFADSMARVCIVREPKDILSYLLCLHGKLRPELKDIAQRYFGPDQRNGWNSWLITLRGTPVLWCDGPISGLSALPPPVEMESA